MKGASIKIIVQLILQHFFFEMRDPFFSHKIGTLFFYENDGYWGPNKYTKSHWFSYNLDIFVETYKKLKGKMCLRKDDIYHLKHERFFSIKIIFRNIKNDRHALWLLNCIQMFSKSKSTNFISISARKLYMFYSFS